MSSNGQSICDIVACPHDKASCVAEKDAFICTNCETRYPVADGVIDFMDADNDFYEGKYLNEISINPRPGLIFELPMWLLVHGYVWAVRKWAKRGATVVELGCAAGVRWFGSRYRMVGVDFSRAGLKRASQDYRFCLRADALSLPLHDGSVDAVISACFFEHVAPSDKARLLTEIYRVLKPGGKVIFQYDIHTANPLIASYRDANPKIYEQEFLAQDGHIGYQTLAENDRIFRGCGFLIKRSVAMERLPLQHSSVWMKLAKWPGLRGRFAKGMAKIFGGWLVLPNTALLRVVDETVGRLVPSSWGRIALTVAEKPAGTT